MMFGKIRAGALQLTLFVATAIALLLGSFLLYVHIYNKYAVASNEVQEVIQNSEDAINFAKSGFLSESDSIEFNKNASTILLHKDYWGVFEKITATAKSSHKTYTLIAMLGGTEATKGNALIANENQSSIVMAGSANIVGNVYITRKGVKPGTIGSRGHYNTSLVKGNIYSTGGISMLDNKLVDELKELPIKFKNVSANNFIVIKSGATYAQSFLDATKFVYSTSSIYLQNTNLKGNIVVQSEKSITISSSTELDKIILIAPSITFEEGFTGNCQAIATDKLRVLKNCTFEYPSVLWLQAPVDSPMEIASTGEDAMPIVIESGVVVKGIIGYYNSEHVPRNFQSQVLIKANATVYGEVYCTHNTEFQGEIFGTCYTNSFIVHYGTSVYQNHILDGVINSNLLHAEYGGLLLKDQPDKTIVMWGK